MKLYLILALAAICLSQTTLDDNLKMAQVIEEGVITISFEYSGDDAEGDVWIGIIPG